MIKNGSFLIGKITIRVKTLFYVLLTLSVVCSVIISIANAIYINDDIFTVLTSAIIFTLCAIGWISIMLEIAKRWRYVGGVLLLGWGLFIIFSLPSAYNYDTGMFYHSPFMISLLFIAAATWDLSGAILITNGKSLLKENTVSD